jgi:hypothetical protein
MLTIENIEKLMGYPIVIKGYPFRIQTVITHPNEYLIGIENDVRVTAHAPITVILSRVDVNGMYRLQKAKGYYDYIELYMEEMETRSEFVSRLMMYLNSIGV